MLFCKACSTVALRNAVDHGHELTRSCLTTTAFRVQYSMSWSKAPLNVSEKSSWRLLTLLHLASGMYGLVTNVLESCFPSPPRQMKKIKQLTGRPGHMRRKLTPFPERQLQLFLWAFPHSCFLVPFFKTQCSLLKRVYCRCVSSALGPDDAYLDDSHCHSISTTCLSSMQPREGTQTNPMLKCWDVNQSLLRLSLSDSRDDLSKLHTNTSLVPPYTNRTCTACRWSQTAGSEPSSGSEMWYKRLQRNALLVWVITKPIYTWPTFSTPSFATIYSQIQILELEKIVYDSENHA